MRRYSHLLSPIRINNVVIKNRTVFPNASPHFLQGPEIFPADPFIAFYANLAKNGAAIVTIAEWSNPGQRNGPADLDFTHMQNFDLSDPSVHNYFSQLADEIHFHGSKLILCSSPKLPVGYSLDGSPMGMGMAPGGPGPDIEWKALPKEMMPQVIDEFIAKLRTYKNIGYDGVDMRVENHLTPHKLDRGDEFGGSVENRTRFLIMLCDRIKEELGRDFIIELCIAGEQPDGYRGEGGGYTLEDGIEFAKLVSGHADILQVRERDMTASHPTGFTYQRGEHEVIRYCEAMKAAGATILLEPIGGFQEPEELDRYIAEGKCDMIGMARAFFADPEYGKKLYQGRGEDITPCLWCNKCHGTIKPDNPDPWLSVCSVNPYFGMEYKLERLIPSVIEPKKVAVIGGGPIGMRAAIFAAEAGHKVTLFEKTDILGGQLIHGDYFSFKWPIGEFKNWLIRRLDQLDVDVRMNCAPTVEMIEQGAYDAVIAATGAEPNIPNFEGLKAADGSMNPGFMTCIDTFGREAELGHKVVICGASETGIETAMYLADNGHDVTLLTRQGSIGHDCSQLHYITMAWLKPDPDGTSHMAPAWEKYANIHGITHVTTKAVTPKSVTYVDADGAEHSIDCDSVVICGGMRSRQAEALEFANCTEKFFICGDAAKVGDLQKGMRAALGCVSNL